MMDAVEVTEDERDVLREHLDDLSMSDDEAAARLRAVRVNLRSYASITPPAKPEAERE